MLFRSDVETLIKWVYRWNREYAWGLREHAPGCWSIGDTLVTLGDIGGNLVRLEAENVKGLPMSDVVAKISHNLRLSCEEVPLSPQWPAGECQRTARRSLANLVPPGLSQEERSAWWAERRARTVEQAAAEWLAEYDPQRRQCVDVPPASTEPAADAEDGDLPASIQGWRRKALRLWRKGLTAPEIGKEVDMAPKTVGNVLSELRGAYGREIVPRNEDRRQKRWKSGTDSG